MIVFSFRPDQLVPRAGQPILEIPAATVRRFASRHLLYTEQFRDKFLLTLFLATKTDCPKNTYSARSSSACHACPANSDTTGTGSTTCRCKAGYVSSGTVGESLKCTGTPRCPQWRIYTLHALLLSRPIRFWFHRAVQPVLLASMRPLGRRRAPVKASAGSKYRCTHHGCLCLPAAYLI